MIKTKTQIWEAFDKKRNKVEILIEAMDYMQQHNDRSKTDCVALVLGYRNDGNGSYIRND